MANKNNKIKGYEIDFTTNTLFMNYKFAEASTQYGTPEYKLLQNIKNDLPNIKIVKRAGRNTKTCNANKRMTYANMENYIKVQDNADELMAAFVIAKEESKNKPSPYAFVRDWFVKQFPNYKECKILKDDNIISFAEAAPTEEQKISS